MRPACHACFDSNTIGYVEQVAGEDMDQNNPWSGAVYSQAANADPMPWSACYLGNIN